MSISLERLSLTALLALGLTLGACAADPAADAPAAEVSEAAPATTPKPAPAVAATTYSFTEDSTIGFVGSKVTGSHDGGFKDFGGSMAVAGDDPTTTEVQVTIQTDSLWTDSEKLTGHLKSADFFDTAAYPTATFQSTGVTENADGTYTVTGDLDLHGVTKSISFPATIEVTEAGDFTANAEFSIKRFDFGIEYKGKADDLIRDDVLIKLDLKAQA